MQNMQVPGLRAGKSRRRSRRRRGALSEHLHWLEGRFDSAGPYIMGKEFSLVDASLLPFFLRLPVLQHYRGFSLPAVRLSSRLPLHSFLFPSSLLFHAIQI